MDCCLNQKHINRLALLLFIMMFNSMGCVSIQVPSRSMPIEYCNRLAPVPSDECCDLYDRREVIARWASQLKPATLIPQQVVGWGALQRQRCVDGCESMKEWMRKKKADANPPPWPRFHPLPTRPAFEPADTEQSMVPQEYGRFCKEN